MEAAEELEQAAAWYAKESHHTVQKWRTAVGETLRGIRQTPKLWAPDHLGVRCVQVKPFPYYIHYGLRDDVIQIYAVAHTSRDEGYWHERLKKQ